MSEPEGIKEKYGREVRQQLRHYPVWDPGSPIKLGDYGRIEDNCFFRLGNIADEFETTLEDDTTSPQLFEFQSSGISVKEGHVDAGVDGIAKGSLELSFEAAYSLYVRAANSQWKALKNVGQVASSLKNQGGWQRSHVFVTGIRGGPSLVLLMNSRAKSSVTISASADVIAAVKSGDVRADAKFQITGDAGLKCIGSKGALFVELARVRFFGGAGTAALGGGLAIESFERVPA